MEKYYHKCQECGDHAFEYKKMPVARFPIMADDIVGEPFQPGDEITCLECHMPIPGIDLTLKNVVTIKP